VVMGLLEVPFSIAAKEQELWLLVIPNVHEPKGT
jgi:hypothetical protein